MKRRWSRRFLGLLGVKLETSGESPARGLLVGNHVSYLDILVLNAVVPSDFVAKAEVRRWPLIGWLCERTDTLFIRRGNAREAHLASRIISRRMREGGRVVVFPEGTTSSGDDVLAFRPGLLQASIDEAQAVHCVALAYVDTEGRRSDVPVYAGDTSLWQSLWAICSNPGLRARVCMLGPVRGAHRRQLAAAAHARVRCGLRELLTGNESVARKLAAPSPHRVQPACNARAIES